MAAIAFRTNPSTLTLVSEALHHPPLPAPHFIPGPTHSGPVGLVDQTNPSTISGSPHMLFLLPTTHFPTIYVSSSSSSVRSPFPHACLRKACPTRPHSTPPSLGLTKPCSLLCIALTILCYPVCIHLFPSSFNSHRRAHSVKAGIVFRRGSTLSLAKCLVHSQSP